MVFERLSRAYRPFGWLSSRADTTSPSRRERALVRRPRAARAPCTALRARHACFEAWAPQLRSLREPGWRDPPSQQGREYIPVAPRRPRHFCCDGRTVLLPLLRRLGRRRRPPEPTAQRCSTALVASPSTARGSARGFAKKLNCFFSASAAARTSASRAEAACKARSCDAICEAISSRRIVSPAFGTGAPAHIGPAWSLVGVGRVWKFG